MTVVPTLPSAWLIACASVWSAGGLIVAGHDERAAAMRLQVLGDGGQPLSAERIRERGRAGESDAQRRASARANPSISEAASGSRWSAFAPVSVGVLSTA